MLSETLLSPPILFFALGMIAASVRSDLLVPKSISRYFALYLMMAIGFKGGVALSETDGLTLDALYVAGAGMIYGCLQPILGFFLLKKTTALDNATAAALSAHYGSVSMVTFATAVSYLEMNHLAYAGYIIAVLALMEAPAIGTGLTLARLYDRNRKSLRSQKVLMEVLTNGAVLLLMGSFVIGLLSGEKGAQQVHAFLVAPFQGFLCFFLLDMGLLVARSKESLKKISLSLIAFALYMPLIGAGLGIATALLIGLDFGTSLLFVILTASASYIAVPAAMRMALPEAKAEVYLPLSLAVTFPFNIIVGIPLYAALLRWCGL